MTPFKGNQSHSMPSRNSAVEGRSGVIEGTCKCLFNQRIDLTWQWWLGSGSLNVLRVRAAIMDGLNVEY